MKINKFSKFFRDDSGTVAIITAIILFFVFIGIAALAIDIGRLAASKNELQNAADAAALAGARKLGEMYNEMSPYEVNNFNCNENQCEDVYTTAQDTLKLNKAAGDMLLDCDVKIGQWINEDFYHDEDPPDAVRVRVGKGGDSGNTPISTFFARIFHVESLDAFAEATAALTGPTSVEEGELKAPFGLSKNVFPDDCSTPIRFSPTTESCAGWHNFFDHINASKMESKLLGLIQGDNCEEYCYDNEDQILLTGSEWLDENFDINKTPTEEVTPETGAGDEYEFQGGTISSLFLGGYLDEDDYDGNTGTVHDNEKKPAPFIALFDYFRYRDGDGDDGKWTTTVPVYADDPDSCINPNTAIEIVGFATIEILMPNPPPDSTVDVYVYCDLSVTEGRGSGGGYGNLRGSIPNLVQ